MAQLRDAQTSEFLAEGTPLQMATLASKLGFDQVIFDGVGEAFDPQAVLDAYASDEHADPDAAKLERGAIKAANDAIAAARARVED